MGLEPGIGYCIANIMGSFTAVYDGDVVAVCTNMLDAESALDEHIAMLRSFGYGVPADGPIILPVQTGAGEIY